MTGLGASTFPWDTDTPAVGLEHESYLMDSIATFLLLFPFGLFFRLPLALGFVHKATNKTLPLFDRRALRVSPYDSQATVREQGHPTNDTVKRNRRMEASASGFARNIIHGESKPKLGVLSAIIECLKPLTTVVGESPVSPVTNGEQ